MICGNGPLLYLIDGNMLSGDIRKNIEYNINQNNTEDNDSDIDFNWFAVADYLFVFFHRNTFLKSHNILYHHVLVNTMFYKKKPLENFVF